MGGSVRSGMRWPWLELSLARPKYFGSKISALPHSTHLRPMGARVLPGRASCSGGYVARWSTSRTRPYGLTLGRSGWMSGRTRVIVGARCSG
eukprot:1543663-Lingulodinium_polyedra.AAC.1